MNEINQDSACVVCGHSRHRLLYSIPPRRIVVCVECGHEYVESIPPDLPKYYFPSADADRLATTIDVAYISSVLEKYGLRRGRILDLGCGQGRIAHALIDAGWDPGRLCLIDISQEDLAVALRACPGVTTVKHDASEPIPFAGPFDCVLMVEFLEDVVNPVRVLRNTLQVVRPGGLIIARGMPNNQSVEAFVGREKWKMRRFLHHHHFFNPHSFRHLLAQVAGITLLEFGSFLQKGFSFFTVERIARNLRIDRWEAECQQPGGDSLPATREELCRRVLCTLRAAPLQEYIDHHLVPIGRLLDATTVEQLETCFDQMCLDYRVSPDFSAVMRRDGQAYSFRTRPG